MHGMECLDCGWRKKTSLEHHWIPKHPALGPTSLPSILWFSQASSRPRARRPPQPNQTSTPDLAPPTPAVIHARSRQSALDVGRSARPHAAALPIGSHQNRFLYDHSPGSHVSHRTPARATQPLAADQNGKRMLVNGASQSHPKSVTARARQRIGRARCPSS